MGRAIVDRQTMHIHDLLAEVDTEYPDSKAIQDHRYSDQSFDAVVA